MTDNGNDDAETFQITVHTLPGPELRWYGPPGWLRRLPAWIRNPLWRCRRRPLTWFIKPEQVEVHVELFDDELRDEFNAELAKRIDWDLISGTGTFDPSFTWSEPDSDDAHPECWNACAVLAGNGAWVWVPEEGCYVLVVGDECRPDRNSGF